jgi:hypothetical protein
MTDNDFHIDLDFGGGIFTALVKNTWRDNNTTSTFEILVEGKRIAQLEMDSDVWISYYGNLDFKTVQYIGSKIESHFL